MISNQLKKFPILVKYPTAEQFIRFCLIGVVSFCIDFGVYFIFTRFVGLYYILSGFLSFMVAVTFSFFANRAWTFKVASEVENKLQALKFFLTSSIGIAINLSLFYLVVDFLHWYDLPAKIAMTVLVVFFNFSLNKFWTFKGVKIDR